MSKKRTPLTIFLAVGILLTPVSRAGAQESRVLPLLDGSSMRIDGTSNKSDWSVEVTNMEGLLWIEDGDAITPDSVFFSARGEDLKSGRSTIMDRLMYEALKTDQYSDIIYTLGSSGIQTVSEDNDAASWNTIGTLELAGVRDTLGARVSGYRDGGRYVFTGTSSMSMREHEITPPTAMFGALRTREWVTIHFNLVFGDQ
jgi:hypothetical protein